MSYTKKTWEVGQKVKSSDLNNMETGIANAELLVITASNINGSMKADKTFAEVSAAISAGRSVYMINRVSKQVLMLCKVEDTKISFECVFPDANTNKGIRAILQSNDVLAFHEITPYFKPNNGIPETDLAQAVKDKLDPFVVTLTPTAQDFSGTMDKTVAEINTAYEAGRRIFFRIYTSATEYVEVDCTMRGRRLNAGNYPSFNAYIIDENNNLLIYAYTSVNASASKNTYSTKIYPITPM